jgi:MFS family permease
MSLRDAPLIRVFRNRDYLLYTIGNGISLIGLWVQRLAVGWLTWQLTHSGFWLGMVAFADLFPALIVGPFAGVLADRFDRTRILRVTQTISLLQAATFWLAYEGGHVNVYIVFALTLGLGINAAITQPARLALIPQLVRSEDMNTALALNSVLFNSARFIGPMVAGLILSVSDLGKTFLFNAFSYLAMIAALIYMKPLPRRTAVSAHSVLHDLGQGVRYCAGHGSIGPLLLMIGVVAIFARPIADLLPGFAGHVFNRGEQGLVWLTSAMGVGSIVAGVWLAQRASVTGLPAITLVSIVVTGCSLVAFAATSRFVLALVLVLIASGAISVCGTATQTLVQRIVDEDKRGRVMSLWGLIFRGAPALGVLMMGALSDWFGLAAPIIGGALVCIVFAAYGLRWRLRLNAEVAAQEN